MVTHTFPEILLKIAALVSKCIPLVRKPPTVLWIIVIFVLRKILALNAKQEDTCTMILLLVYKLVNNAWFKNVLNVSITINFVVIVLKVMLSMMLQGNVSPL